MKLSICLATAALAAQAQWYGDDYAAPKDSYYSECPNLDHLEHLDTAEYQAMSAKCKQELIWKRVKQDDTPERFFVGTEFMKTFN